ncbi:MAG: hypothetical protein AAFY20_18450 [Cyanobacteria bacterium J06639_14]
MRQDYSPAPFVRVKLLGRLGRLFGRTWRVRARTTQEAVRAIAANCPKLKAYLSDDSVGYRVFRGKAPINQEEELAWPIAAECLIVCPTVWGSGGFGRILLGVALIGAGFLLGGSTWFLLGATMILSGVSELISPQPSTPKSGETDESFLFSQASNTSRDADPVPLVYGEPVIRSMPVLSSGVETHEI